jgi:hypothetical protein
VLAHEAYLSVIALGQLLQHDEERLAPTWAIESARGAVDRTLDTLAPFVSRADEGLRRVLLDNVPSEDALAAVSRGGDCS